ncbi:hypothetical protein E2320_015287, partial [Naja naja]
GMPLNGDTQDQGLCTKYRVSQVGETWESSDIFKFETPMLRLGWREAWIPSFYSPPFFVSYLFSALVLQLPTNASTIKVFPKVKFGSVGWGNHQYQIKTVQ